MLVPNNFGPKLYSCQKIVIQKICVRKFRGGGELSSQKLLVQCDFGKKKKLEKDNLMKKNNLVKNFGQENFCENKIKKCWSKRSFSLNTL